MGSTKKLLALSMAIVSVAAACGGGDSSSGRQRNSALPEVATCVTAQKNSSDAVLVDLELCADAVRYSVSLNDTAESEQKDVPSDRKLQVTTFGIDPTAVYKFRSFAADGTLIATDVLSFTYGAVGGEGKSCADGGACVPGDGGPLGGIVFYGADSPQQWGQYLAALPMIENKVVFGCNNVAIEGTTDGIGDGAANTSIIEKACADDPSPAVASVRSALPQAYLPTRLEMFEMAKVLGGREGFIFDLNAASPPNRPIVSYMPMVGVEGTSDTEVHRRNNVVDFMLYPTGWSHMQTFRTTEYNVWPVYAFSKNDVRPVETVTVTAETPSSNAASSDDAPGAGDNNTPSVGGLAPTNVTVERLDESNVAVSWTNPPWVEFASIRVEIRYTLAHTDVDANGDWVAPIYVEVGTATSWTGAAGIMPALGDPEFRVVALNADKSVAHRSASVVLKNPEPTQSSGADELQAVIDACKEATSLEEYVKVVNFTDGTATLSTDAPVTVEMSPGCDIPEKFAERVKVVYQIMLVGAKHFTNWTSNGSGYLIPAGASSQLLPADTYSLSYRRDVQLDGTSVFGGVPIASVTKNFDVKEGSTEAKVECADSDLTFSGTTLVFPCQFIANLELYVYDKRGNLIEGGRFTGERSIELKTLGSGWKRVEGGVSNSLLRQWWRLYLCHTDCGPVAPSSGYKVTKSNDVITLSLPPCDVSTGDVIDFSWLAPLRAMSPGVLRRFNYSGEPFVNTDEGRSFPNPQSEIFLYNRSEPVTFTDSAGIAGVVLLEWNFCMSAGDSQEVAIFDVGTAEANSPAEASTSTSEPAKVETNTVVQPLTVDVASVIASPVKLADNVTRVEVTLTDSSDDSSALSMSLDGTRWVPVPRGQPVSLNRSDVASLQVRSVNSKGEMRQVVQTVVSNASGESSSNASGAVSGDSDSSGSSKLWIVVVILVLLTLIAVLMRGRRSKAKE